MLLFDGKLNYSIYKNVQEYFKATFSCHKLIPKNAQMTTLYTNWALYIIILDKNNFVKVSHHYLTSGGYQVFL